MSFDGSFCIDSALERFLSRHPNLRSTTKFSSLYLKGKAATADEVVAAVADPFLHPSYTVPVMGCFRPLARRIVERVIVKLRSVPTLESEPGDPGDPGEEIGEDEVCVVDFYILRGRGLRLHEIASLAFCRALDLAPFLLSDILSYFGFSPPPFRRLLPNESPWHFGEKVQYYANSLNRGTFYCSLSPLKVGAKPDEAYTVLYIKLTRGVFPLLDAIRVSYRFLLMEPKVFSELWNWSCFLDLVEETANLDIGDATSSLNCLLDVRWCTIQILAIVFRISDRATKSFGMGQDEAFSCFLRWEEFCQDTSIEKTGWYLQGTDVENGSYVNDLVNYSYCLESFENSVSSNYKEIKPERMDHRISCDLKLSGSPFVLTSAVKKSFEMVIMAVSQRWPVLLHGPVGAGKSALINRLAHISGNQVLCIHMDEQMDSKTLIGSYICSERPGEFRWQPGSLTQAILNGIWVVFEDIDKAPNEVQSIILPLLEGSSAFITGHGEAISVAGSFRLFATISTCNDETCHGIEGRFSFSALWRKVRVGAPSDVDMLEIINTWHPNLEAFSSKLVDTFQRINFLATGHVGQVNEGGVLLAGAFSRFTIRDLLKWCKRVTGLDLNFSGLGLSNYDRQKIYQEAFDIFVASLPSLANRLFAMREIARLWGVPEPENVYPPGKPVIQNLRSGLQVGRATLQCMQTLVHQRRPFIGLRNALHVLERITVSVKHCEPVLLVGETGTGKTTLVQNLAMRLGQPLTVMNLSQQTDVGDLLGGYKPTDARSICIPLFHEFKELFRRTFSIKDNEDLLRHCEEYIMQKKWNNLLKACQKAVSAALKYVSQTGDSDPRSKRKRPVCEEVLRQWESFSLNLDTARKQIGSSAGVSFKFVEGAFIAALRNGHWILLDEVNLAPPETLQRIVGVLDGQKGTLCLAERGDVGYVERHSQFRLFACMNPATDAGKRELPYSFRSRFSEYFVDEVLDDDDLALFVDRYMDESDTGLEMVNRIVKFYKAAKKESEEKLQDSANQKPQFSLRSLARSLEYAKKAEKKFGFQKAIYDGFCMFFLTLLDGPSAKVMKIMILSYLLGGVVPPNIPFDSYLTENLKIQDISDTDTFMKNYVITRSVNEQLKNLARAVYIKRYPVLLQGPTSSGKTSLVHYLATLTGHEFVRVNNHEHTDLQEYLGTYITDSQGRLRFQEGVLVKAVRNGYWIVLDELNLAPSDVLEALNRLLDDNRELFVPETQETVSAHPDFMLFATQNPPMIYGGRKVLSRAFRNRFLEIHVDEIPDDELTTILEKRCCIPASYACKMVEVMKDLQLHRQNSKAFAGKHGFITPRDLFRWANRFSMFGKSYEDLAKDGYLLLAERLRDEHEKNVVLETLQRHLRVKLVTDDLYKVESSEADAISKIAEHPAIQESCGRIIWTRSMWKLYFLVERCYRLREPVLLVGETGGGKTTVCQLLSAVLKARLHILNCHQYSETSDFVGGFYPVRDRSRLSMEYKHHIERARQSNIFQTSQDTMLSTDISHASSTINQLNEIERQAASNSGVAQQDLDAFIQVKVEILHLYQKWQAIFVWQDGPLVQAMKDGDLFLVDEISLADDSVLERLNSVLEPERKLSLAEKGGSVLEKITAHPNFFILATMNPGGDYGKKELSPALRNRFTEIWVSPVSDVDELRCIAAERFLRSDLSHFSNYIVKFWQWFNQLQTGRILTVRDLLSWVSFVNATESSLGSEYAFIHGAFLVLLDGLSLGTGISKADANKLRESSLSFLVEELKVSNNASVDLCLSNLDTYGWGNGIKFSDDRSIYDHPENLFGISPFYITKGHKDCKQEGFEFLAPTTCRNALRVLRAMQLSKPVLLEGSPGVGKTSLVVALAEYSGHNVVRINLSEQTDMMDLLGSDLPVEGVNGMEFAWSDGILLQALKDGCWVLLDELNLAPQSVLEGLNAILDHRAEVYIPEIGLTFKCPPSFRVFACQNPSCQGGGRKSLPKSFLNRFTKVYVDELSSDDYLFICQSRFPSIPKTLLSKLISFNNRLYEETMLFHKYGQDGSPWEFNLRDVIRSCQIIESASDGNKIDCFLNIVYLQRMRSSADREEVVKLFDAVFEVKPSLAQSPQLFINTQYLVVGNAHIARNHFQPTKVMKSQLKVLPGILQSLEAAVRCVQQQWLCILVGPYSSGKTSLIRLLAQLTGNALIELNLSSATDVSELLGCFEQYNSFRVFRSVMSQIECYVDEYFALRLELSWKDFICERKSLFSKWFTFLSASNYNSSMSTTAFARSWKNGSCRSLSPLVEIIELLRHDLEKYNLPMSWSFKDLDETLKTVFDLQQNKMIHLSTKFQWVAGELIKAIECGNWVVLENANLCNPTVLDRINSLVEQDGSITVNERGLVDGKAVTLSAHPKFRMFLTVDPKHGEVSRAMRNRGLEIFLMQPTWVAELDSEDTEMNDLRRFLTLSGIPFTKLVLAMSEAHMYAKTSGLRSGLRITLLELDRWVQLFQQLLMNGNQPRWSLQLSWEHIYLSSLGEFEGKDTIMQAKHLYLSDIEWDKVNPGCCLFLTGGLFGHQSIRNLLCYSKEACVRQNCMYLEILGAECASDELYATQFGTIPLHKCRKIKPSAIPVNMMRYILFPNASDPQNNFFKKLVEFDLADIKKMMFFASNWTLEQATESDFGLYVQWFKQYLVQLQPHCRFLESFLKTLEQERDHPIWNFIFYCWRMIISHLKIDTDALPIPLLSAKLVELASSDESLIKCRDQLDNAIRCVPLLRLTYQQWNAEITYAGSEEALEFMSLLNSLRCLEVEVLRVIFESQNLFQIYSSLLEHHMLFWRSITSSQLDHLWLVWSWIKKDALKLQPQFEEAVGDLLMTSLGLKNVSTCRIYVEKSLLWAHGGHPFIPSSGDVYYKMQQLLRLCGDVWPRTRKKSDEIIILDVVLSSNTELRRLAMQAVSMSSYIITMGDKDDSDIMIQLEQLYQCLSIRCEHERRDLDIVFCSSGSLRSPLVRSSNTTCCSFYPEILFKKYGFESWLMTLPLNNKKSLSLDIKLLQELSKFVLVDPSEAYQVLIDTSDLLQHVLDYSLDLSSRSPADFAAHQTLLWIMNAWNSVNSVQVKIANSLLEMWFKWHSALWHCSSEALQSFSLTGYDESFHIMNLARSAMLDKILQEKITINDYEVQNLKLRVASRNLWQDGPLNESLVGVFLSSADSLFKQILFVHQKSFDEDVFRRIKSILYKDTANGMNHEQLQTLKVLILSSSHNVLNSLVDPVIEPLLEELYFRHQSHDSVLNLGFAWLHIGFLRFHLLLPDGPDPAQKYAYKHSQMVDKMSLLELEIKVRRECRHLAGRGSIEDDERQRVSSLEKLEKEKKRIHSKVVFRPEHLKHKRLRSEFTGFLEVLSSCIILVKKLKSNADLSVITDIASNWQVTSALFIARLSDEYAEYVDLVQPVQVAVYEMKLGLSMAVSAAREREYLRRIDTESIETILATIYLLMQFPREFPAGFTPNYIQSTRTSCDLEASKRIHIIDTNLLKKLVTISSEIGPDKEEVSRMQLPVMIQHIILIYVAHHVSCSLLMDKALFLHLNEILYHFVSMWMDMKSQNKVKEDGEAQYYKFRPRPIKIEDILEEDFSTLSMLESDGYITSECEEKLIEQEFTEVKQPTKEYENEEEWGLIPESILKNIVAIHNQLFGSRDLVEHPGVCQITDESRVNSFTDSYKLGARIIKDLQGLSTSSMDDNLVPEHLFRACLENIQTLDSTSHRSDSYNIYKDSNAPIMSNMVKPLNAVKDKVTFLLEEWPDHPGLQKIMDVTNGLLTIPLDSPLSKALLGLQLLVSRARSLSENFSSFSLTDELQPIDSLVTSWQKLELDCWPTLLDGIQEKYEINAGKLWFPLHAVLHRNLSSDDEVHNTFTIQSLEEFIQTSCVGEFKKRLHLLLAFHGQLNQGICLEAYSSPRMKENLNILYNTFGYYVQFLPLVLEHIESSRRKIEKELKECLKLYNWEHSSIESFRRTRQKIWKHIKKFNDTLQQPVMIILNQDITVKREKIPSWLEQKDGDDLNVEVQFPLDLGQLSNMKRFLWYEEWRKKTSSAMQTICCGSTSDVGSLKFKDIGRSYESTSDHLMTTWSGVWTSIEKICRSAAQFAHLWKLKTKNLNQRRALADLLKMLESCGLSKYRSMVLELEFKSGQPISSFVQPSYTVDHLLQPEFSPSSKLPNGNPPKPADGKCDMKWEAANRGYFKNLVMVQQLREVSLNFKKDLTLEQVKRAASFIEDLIIIQQQQRLSVYGVSELLQKLRQQSYMLSSIGGECSITPNQHAVLKCMWHQKHLFDNLLAMSKDVRLLIQSVKSSHVSACEIIRIDADEISVLIDNFIPVFLQVKVLLDKTLIGSDGKVAMSMKCVPFIVSKEMEDLINMNFQILNNFEKEIKASCMQKASMRFVKESLLKRLEVLVIKERSSLKLVLHGLGMLLLSKAAAEATSVSSLTTAFKRYPKIELAFQDFLGKALMAEFNSAVETNDQSTVDEYSFNEVNDVYSSTVEEMNELLLNVFRELDHFHGETTHSGEMSADITLWKDLFEKHVKKLHLNQIYDALCSVIVAAIKLVNCGASRKVAVCSQVESYMKHLHVSLDLLLTFGEGIISEFLDAHKTMTEMTHVLAQLFVLLFSKGFGAAEESTEDTTCDGSQNVNGTGMGEGEGMNDVSDQIDDESQLLGTSEKEDELGNSDKVQSNKDKGIEMDEDFAAETCSVSEDSGDDENEDEEDVNLDSQMGQSEDGNQIVDEKLWNKNEDDKPENSVEKYESGPSVKETDVSDKEIRAREDDALLPDESGELGNDEPDKELCNEENSNNISDDEGKSDDMNLDKNKAFEEPSGVQLSDQEQNLDDMEMDENQEMQETDSDPDEADEHVKDEDMGDENANQMDDDPEAKEEDADNVNMDLESTQATFESNKIESSLHPPLDHQPAEPVRDSHEAASSIETEMHWTSNGNMITGLAPSRSSPFDEIPKTDSAMPDTSDGAKLTSDQPKTHTSEDDTPSVTKTPSNPYRSIGDAMKEWKERVKVAVDPQEQLDGPDDHDDDENADEYKYVSEFEKSTIQALGSATSDQTRDNIERKSPNEDDADVRKKEDVVRMDPVNEHSDTCNLTTGHSSLSKQKLDEEMRDTVVSKDELVEEQQQDNQNGSSTDMVSFERSYMKGRMMPVDDIFKRSLDMKPMDLDLSDDVKQKAMVDWKRYELATGKVSQQLAEQLRLVMEPTLASKLQGDYRTGKRINMKKVIPYIASHYRKDKIWLRRTRPNKRDYQVVVAVDDSRSMSESHCGNAAVESLVTVCRAMSQLEVGQFAVASFGEKGNIRLLHDFEQPFTGDAGVKIISSLSFKQDNTIADEPVVDLLKYLNNMLDTAVVKARTPSGQNPLHQLILIIADGRFHEKEKLKRCVRNVLNRKRMVAFIVLDSPNESIMNVEEASFEGGKVSITKYLNSFPFPYYIILRNMETLPLALADLLRQWFELMQSTSD